MALGLFAFQPGFHLIQFLLHFLDVFLTRSQPRSNFRQLSVNFLRAPFQRRKAVFQFVLLHFFFVDVLPDAAFLLFALLTLRFLFIKCFAPFAHVGLRITRLFVLKLVFDALQLVLELQSLPITITCNAKLTFFIFADVWHTDLFAELAEHLKRSNRIKSAMYVINYKWNE